MVMAMVAGTGVMVTETAMDMAVDTEGMVTATVATGMVTAMDMAVRVAVKVVAVARVLLLAQPRQHPPARLAPLRPPELGSMALPALLA